MAKQIGIFPGSFDPIHQGHIAFALQAIDKCQLDQVFFIPVRQPIQKQNISALSHRLADLEKATKKYSNLNIAELKSDHFTVKNTLPELLIKFYDAKLTLLVGSDVAVGLRSWPHVERLLNKTSLAIGLRRSDSSRKIDKIIKAIESKYAIKIEYTIIQTRFPLLASSHLR